METVFVSIVTAPTSAMRLPATVERAVAVMLVIARTFPTNFVLVPSVAELPTCQNTFEPVQAAPASTTTTDALLAVVSVEAILRLTDRRP